MKNGNYYNFPICPGSLTDRTCGYGPQDVGSTPAQGANRKQVV